MAGLALVFRLNFIKLTLDRNRPAILFYILYIWSLQYVDNSLGKFRKDLTTENQTCHKGLETLFIPDQTSHFPEKFTVVQGGENGDQAYYIKERYPQNGE